MAQLPQTKHSIIELENSWLTFWFNRPEKRNALSDDLNTPRAISVLHELSSEQKKNPSQQNRDNLIAAGSLLGFFNFEYS